MRPFAAMSIGGTPSAGDTANHFTIYQQSLPISNCSCSPLISFSLCLKSNGSSQGSFEPASAVSP